jgi:hypothetical protein
MITETGPMTFAAGGTYTSNVTATISYMEMTPSSCLTPLTCADLAAGYVDQGASATCSGTTVCACSIALTTTGAAAGTYTTTGTSMTIIPPSGTPNTMGYCVQGNSLHLLHFNSAGQVTTEEILQRQ